MRACLASFSGGLGVSHHEESDGLQATAHGRGRSAGWRRLPRCSEWPCGRSGRAVVLCGDDVVLGAQTRAASGRRSWRAWSPSRPRALISSCSGVRREAVVEGGPAEAVAVGDLDDRDAPAPSRAPTMASDLFDGELVTLVVGAVAQAGVGQSRISSPNGSSPWMPTRCRSALMSWRSSPPRSQKLRRAMFLADLGGCGRHDVEVAGVRRQEVACAFDLDEDRDRRMPPETSLGPSNWGSLQQPVARARTPGRPSTITVHGVGDARPVSASSGDGAEDRVAHDHRRLGGVEDDDRLAASARRRCSRSPRPWWSR